jgi:hypothetical protein
MTFDDAYRCLESVGLLLYVVVFLEDLCLVIKEGSLLCTHGQIRLQVAGERR